MSIKHVLWTFSEVEPSSTLVNLLNRGMIRALAYLIRLVICLVLEKRREDKRREDRRGKPSRAVEKRREKRRDGNGREGEGRKAEGREGRGENR